MTSRDTHDILAYEEEERIMHEKETAMNDDDIVERLRLWATVNPDMVHVIEDLHKAADEIERLHALNEREKFLVRRIVEAITNKGSHPDYHDRILNKQRRLHPTLWNPLDKLVQSICGTTLTNRAKWEGKQND